MINSFSRETLNQEIAFQMHLIFDFFFTDGKYIF